MAKAKSLKELNDQITSVRSTQLEARIGTTIMGRYVEEMDAFFEAGFKSRYGNISMPTLQFFADKHPKLRESLINLYDSVMGNVKGVEYIPENIKMSQGALLDGLCFVYDMKDGSVTLATMNLDVLCDLDIEFDMTKQIIKKNLDGFCKAYRIDVDYNNDSSEFTFAAVNARDYDIDDAKEDSDESKRFVLVPYISSTRLMKWCEYFLNKGNVLRVQQTENGAKSVRFITRNEAVLKEYCDNPYAVEGVKTRFFPLKAMFYAPVLGASSLSSMVSRVSLFSVDMIRRAKPEDLEKSLVTKPKNPLRDMIGERLFVQAMLRMKDKNPEEYAKALKSLSYSGKLILSPEDTTRSSLLKYLHSVTPAAVEKAYRIADVSDDIKRYMEFFDGNPRLMTKEELSDLSGTLRNHVCKFTIQKSDCTLGSVLVTNSASALVRAYGKNYYGVYESFAARFNKLSDTLDSILCEMVVESGDTEVGSTLWADVKSDLEDYGFKFDDDVFSTLCSLAEESINDADGDHDHSLKLYINRVKAFLAEQSGVNLSRSESASKSQPENIIRCRSLEAYVDDNGKVIDYYKNLDSTKIISAYVIA